MDTDMVTVHARLRKVFNVPCHLISEEEVEFKLDGWPFDAFTRTGKLGLWSILRVFEVTRVLATTHLSHVYSHRSQSEDGTQSLAVVMAQNGTFARSMYRDAAMVSPMRGTVSIAHIGRTSFTLLIELYAEGTKECIGSVERLIVYKNLSTNKAMMVPPPLARLRDKIESGAKFKIDVFGIDRAHIPPYQFKTKVGASDMDLVYHTNQAMYFKFCMDAAHEAGKHGFLKNFSLDICEYEASHAQCKYTGECFAGDWINVFVWEDIDSRWRLHFEIKKEDYSVFLANVTFHNLHQSRL